MSDIILFGAGTIGRLVARQLVEKGQKPKCFADNDRAKWGTEVEGIVVQGPDTSLAMFPNAEWVSTVLRTPFRGEILEQLGKMGVKHISLYEFIPARFDLPPYYAFKTISGLFADQETKDEFLDQLAFRRAPSTHVQRPPRDIRNVYFEDFFTRLDDEVFIDCGGADGDTIKDFQSKWNNYSSIQSFEPDPENYRKLAVNVLDDPRVHAFQAAVSDFTGSMSFSATGDQTAHLGDGDELVSVYRLDQVLTEATFIKMDIEGAELEALWGARDIIRKHSPVLAICAYHTGDHLWQIPLLIHAIQPNYRLYFRRYLEATWELVYYAVPPDRVK